MFRADNFKGKSGNMSFKGPGGSKRLGLAICCSVVAHIVAFGFLMLIGGGSTSAPTAPAPSPSGADEVAGTPGSEVEDPIAAAAKADAERAANEAAKRESVAQNAKSGRTKPETKAGSAKKAAETRRPAEKKTAEKKPEAAKPEVRDDGDADEPDKAEWKTYEVRPGDSLTKIAKKCGCTVQELAKANGLKPTANLNLGQKIKIKASAE